MRNEALRWSTDPMTHPRNLPTNPATQKARRYGHERVLLPRLIIPSCRSLESHLHFKGLKLKHLIFGRSPAPLSPSLQLQKGHDMKVTMTSSSASVQPLHQAGLELQSYTFKCMAADKQPAPLHASPANLQTTPGHNQGMAHFMPSPLHQAPHEAPGSKA